MVDSYYRSLFFHAQNVNMLYFPLLRSKPEYTYVAWYSTVITGFHKLRRMQGKFSAIYTTYIFSKYSIIMES
jgi:hypothetical protein